MATTYSKILIRRGATVPDTLAQGELFLDTAENKLYTGASDQTPIQVTGTTSFGDLFDDIPQDTQIIQYSTTNGWQFANPPVDGEDGNDGRKVELAVYNFNGDNGLTPHLQWRYEGDNAWTNLYDLSLAKGADGLDGTDGLGWTGATYDANTGVITFTSDDGLGFTTGDLRGTDGTDGTDGTNGTDGTDGTAVELAVNNNVLQWRYVGELTWTDIFDLSTLAVGTGTYTENTKATLLNNQTFALSNLASGNKILATLYEDPTTLGQNYTATESSTLEIDLTTQLRYETQEATTGICFDTDNNPTIIDNQTECEFNVGYTWVPNVYYSRDKVTFPQGGQLLRSSSTVLLFTAPGTSTNDHNWKLKISEVVY